MDYIKLEMDTREEDSQEYFGKSIGEMVEMWQQSLPAGTLDGRKHIFQSVNWAEPATILQAYRHPWYSGSWIHGSPTCAAEYEKDTPWARAFEKYATGEDFLEYGTGYISQALWVADIAKSVTTLDVGNPFFMWFQWRCEKREWPIKCLHVANDLPPIEGPYGFVYSSEVLEHVNNPVKALWHISNHMKNGGYLYLSVFFNDCDGNDPSHLVWNNVFQDVSLWYQVMRQLGFELVGRDRAGVAKLFRKIRPITYNLRGSVDVEDIVRSTWQYVSVREEDVEAL